MSCLLREVCRLFQEMCHSLKVFSFLNVGISRIDL